MTAAGRVPAALAAAFAVSILCLGGRTADDPADRLPKPAEEARARALFQELRCVQCQNESIDDSQAPIAQDLRRIVRIQIAAGRSDAQVKDFLVQRYGEFILLTPTMTPGNLALWLTPFAIVLFGGGYLWMRSRQPVDAPAALTEEELRDLEAMGAEDQDMLPPHSGQTIRDAAATKH